VGAPRHARRSRAGGRGARGSRRLSDHFDLDAVSRDERDPAHHHAIRRRLHGAQPHAREHDACHLGDLGLGERGADAPSDAATEGQPRARPGAAVEEPVGTERGRLGIQVFAVVHRDDVRVDADPCRERVTGDRPRRRPLGRVDHRPQPQRLGHHRSDIRAVVGLVGQARQYRRRV